MHSAQELTGVDQRHLARDMRAAQSDADDGVGEVVGCDGGQAGLQAGGAL